MIHDGYETDVHQAPRLMVAGASSARIQRERIARVEGELETQAGDPATAAADSRDQVRGRDMHVDRSQVWPEQDMARTHLVLRAGDFRVAEQGEWACIPPPVAIPSFTILCSLTPTLTLTLTSVYDRSPPFNTS